jgi:hypothetical protein
MKKKQIIRQDFRIAVFDRDGHQCVFCEAKGNLDAHHITDRSLMPTKITVKNSLIRKSRIVEALYRVYELLFPKG